jgi:hypothetical protein
MLDSRFADTVASALSAAVASVQGEGRSWSADQPEDVQRVCRRAAWQLLFDLDGQSMLDLALAKISAEQELPRRKAA